MSSLPNNPSRSFVDRNPALYGNHKSEEPKPEIVVTESATLSKLNKTERKFYEMLRSRPYIEYIGVQDITFRLGYDCRYTPDFSTRDSVGIVTFWEVKGFFRDDAKVKIKVAATMWPNFKFILARWESGAWSLEEVKK